MVSEPLKAALYTKKCTNNNYNTKMLTKTSNEDNENWLKINTRFSGFYSEGLEKLEKTQTKFLIYCILF